MTGDPLPSWREGPVKSALIDFITSVTTEGSPDFRPPPERIAVFDNDGTLWCEHPVPVQVLFTEDRIAALAKADPLLRERQPFKAFLEHDLKTLHALGKQALFTIGFAVHAGITVDDFQRMAALWMKTAEHPSLRRPCTTVVYQPQLELMSYLRAQHFKTFIVSGGGSDFIRAFAEELYGVPPEQVIGSTVKTRFEAYNGHCNLRKLGEIDSFDDRETKVSNIGLHIGRRPILAFGNSDGDLAMMRYTICGKGAHLALLLHHDDAEREVAYDREFRISPLAEALDRAQEFGVQVVSMKRDWATVFADRARPQVTRVPRAETARHATVQGD
jgi:phosphoserine phosphatase